MKNLSEYIKLAAYIIIYFAFSFSCSSQEFAPIGTRWIYTSEESAFIAYRPYYIEVIGEQNFNGKVCKKLRLNSVRDAFIYQDSLKVYAYSDWSNQFYLLYDFDAKAGDTVRMENISNETDNNVGSCVIFIDSVKAELICGKLRKSWYYSPIMKMDTMYLWEMGRKYVEGIGDLKFLFPQYGLAAPHIGDLRCFYDSLNDCKFVNYACDSIIYIVNTKKNNIEKISIYPNPVKDELIIDGVSEIKNLRYAIFDVSGKVMLSGVYTNLIITSSLDQGLYFLGIENDNQKNHYIKFSKL